MEPNSNMEILTVEEVATMLKIEPRTVYRKVKAKAIPGVFRVGVTGAIRFAKQDILNWINEQIQRQ